MENYKTVILTNGDKVEVLQYLPMVQKATFISFLANECFVDLEDGIKVFSPIEYELNRLYAYLKFYTNVDFAEDANLYDIYDQFKSTDDFGKILEVIPDGEITSIEIMLDEAIEEKKEEIKALENKNNKIKEDENLNLIIKDFLDRLLQKIPDDKQIKKLTKSIVKDLKSISPNNWDMLTNIFKEQIKQIIPEVKKSGGK